MGNQLKDVKMSARALLGDPLQDWVTDDYLMPLVAQAWDQALLYLKNTCSPFVTRLVEGLAYPAGTTTLIAQPGQQANPFATLMNPFELEWKLAGQPDNLYRFGERVDILPNITPVGPPAPGKLWWEWRSYQIFVTPLNFAVDFRVRGEFIPPTPVKDTDVIVLHPLMARALGYAVAALAGGERINQSYIQTWQSQASMMYDDISADLVRQGQNTTVRVGKMSRHGSGRGRRGSYVV